MAFILCSKYIRRFITTKHMISLSSKIVNVVRIYQLVPVLLDLLGCIIYILLYLLKIRPYSGLLLGKPLKISLLIFGFKIKVKQLLHLHGINAIDYVSLNRSIVKLLHKIWVGFKLIHEDVPGKKYQLGVLNCPGLIAPKGFLKNVYFSKVGALDVGLEEFVSIVIETHFSSQNKVYSLGIVALLIYKLSSLVFNSV